MSLSLVLSMHLAMYKSARQGLMSYVVNQWTALDNSYYYFICKIYVVPHHRFDKHLSKAEHAEQIVLNCWKHWGSGFCLRQNSVQSSSQTLEMYGSHPQQGKPISGLVILGVWPNDRLVQQESVHCVSTDILTWLVFNQKMHTTKRHWEVGVSTEASLSSDWLIVMSMWSCLDCWLMWERSAISSLWVVPPLRKWSWVF